MSEKKTKKAAGLKNHKKSPADRFGRDKNGKVKAGPGRPKGLKNKYPQMLMELVFEIEEDLAKKKKGLRDCADQDPKWFYEKFLSKILPKPVDVSGDIEGNITISWEK